MGHICLMCVLNIKMCIQRELAYLVLGRVDYVLVSDHQWSNFISEQKMDRVCWNSFCYLFKLPNWHCMEHYWTRGLWQNIFSFILNSYLGDISNCLFNFNIITQLKKVKQYFLKFLFWSWIKNFESPFATLGSIFLKWKMSLYIHINFNFEDFIYLQM